MPSLPTFPAYLLGFPASGHLNHGFSFAGSHDTNATRPDPDQMVESLSMDLP